MRIAYLDCFSGISGDMFLAALVDAGVSPDLLRDAVTELNRAGDLGVHLEISRVQRSGISATKVNVFAGEKKDEPRVEHHHYHSHEHGHTHEHAHENGLGHTHAAVAVRDNAGGTEDRVAQPLACPERGREAPESNGSPAVHIHNSEDANGDINRVAQPPSAVHRHNGAENLQGHTHRGLSEIRTIIEKTSISAAAKQRALAIFHRLGEAEAKIHGIPVEQVHFHEVGAADAITDIVCAAVAAEALGVDEWVCSPLNVGSGTVECAHGRFPVPAPATAELLRDAPVFSPGLQAELVTPTGAAIASTLVSRYASLPELKISKIGYGAGTRDFSGHANVLRLIVGETSAVSAPNPGSAQTETVSVLECNVDDLSPQVLAYAAERVLAEGALDVFSCPIQMKKGRIGTLLTVLARTADSARLAGLIFSETSTLGIRVREERRFILPRHHATVTTPWGDVRVKIAQFDSDDAQIAPEYEDCRRLAEQHAVPLKRVMEEALRAFTQSASAELAKHA